MNDSRSSAADEKPDWKHNGLRIIRGRRTGFQHAANPGMTRAEAISHAKVGAQKLWLERSSASQRKTGPHHHGELETSSTWSAAAPAFAGEII